VEVNDMHALHRPRVSRVIAVTVTAAVLAIVLTLAITSSVSDLGSPSASAGVSSPPATVSVSAPIARVASNPFTRSPFSSLLRAPIVSPWAQSSP
jgi:hypothetical protein